MLSVCEHLAALTGSGRSVTFNPETEPGNHHSSLHVPNYQQRTTGRLDGFYSFPVR